VQIGVARLAGLVWVAYFGLSVAGGTLKILPLSVAANAVYFVVAVVLFRFLGPADRPVAFAMLAFAAVGCVIQSVGMIQSDRDIQRTALAFFGLFDALLGYLLLRSRVAPSLIGYALVAGGLGSFTLIFPQTPAPVAAVAFGVAALAEGGLVLWLLLAGQALT
jgi:uncharacterized membrane protein HdeD (DUF308 family)